MVGIPVAEPAAQRAPAGHLFLLAWWVAARNAAKRFTSDFERGYFLRL
jgi:hypothetical protein